MFSCNFIVFFRAELWSCDPLWSWRGLVRLALVDFFSSETLLSRCVEDRMTPLHLGCQEKLQRERQMAARLKSGPQRLETPSWSVRRPAEVKGSRCTCICFSPQMIHMEQGGWFWSLRSSEYDLCMCFHDAKQHSCRVLTSTHQYSPVYCTSGLCWCVVHWCKKYSPMLQSRD